MQLLIQHFLRGYVRIQMKGSSYDRFFNLCAFHGIRLWALSVCGDVYEANLSIRDFKKMKGLTKKSHVSVCIKARYGLPFFVYKYRKRKVCLLSIAAALFFTFWLSSHIWNITVEGNLSQTDDVIFEYLEQSGIVHGMSKAKVDCKNLAASIRNYFSQFSWVSVQMKGTQLSIQVKEGILTEDAKSSTDSPSYSFGGTSLAASKNGTVVSIYVRRGIPLISPGDEVEPGTLLVSGLIPIYDDSSTAVSWQYTDSDADIVIQTELAYTDKIQLEQTKKVYTGRKRHRTQLRLGSMVFALPSFLDDFETCDILQVTHQLQVKKNFYLPIYISQFTAREYKTQQIQLEKSAAEENLEARLQYFIKKLEEKGVQIFENNVKIEWNQKSAIATGFLTVGEKAVSRVAAGKTEEELLKNEYG